MSLFRSLFGKLFGVDPGVADLLQMDTVTGVRYPTLRGPANKVQAFTTTPQTLTLDGHNEKVIVLDRAAGITVTLPALASTGKGYRIRFYVKTTASGGSYIVKVANSTDIIQGVMIQRGDDAASLGGFIAGASDDTVTLNGTTTGGFKGDTFDLTDVGNNTWLLRGATQATGTEATPFSATV